MSVTDNISNQQFEFLSQLKENGKLPFNADEFVLITNKGQHCVWRAIGTNENYIIRMPKSIDNNPILQELQHESEITKLIAAQNLSFITSEVKMFSDEYTFAYHKEVPGQLLTIDTFNTLNNEQKSILAKNIAQFLCQLHAIELNKINCTTPQPESKSFSNEYLINNFDYANAKKSLKTYGINLDEFKTDITYDPVLCHNDLHGENLTIDIKEHKVLNGVFDFGNTDIANRSFDFIKINNLNRGFCRQVICEYNRISSHKVNQKEVDYQLLCWHAINIANFNAALNNKETELQEKNFLNNAYDKFKNKTSQNLASFRIDYAKERLNIGHQPPVRRSSVPTSIKQQDFLNL